ncbi:Protein LAZY 1 [Vitis vinifera]|uniref:Protein LAZY 1 n=1 Tax=Vitis vinifera TaxID=29760 RepID=A0A438DX30_VITVI|nr:Protein LAZY 1 [Vitis vinifera]
MRLTIKSCFSHPLLATEVIRHQTLKKDFKNEGIQSLLNFSILEENLYYKRTKTTLHTIWVHHCTSLMQLLGWMHRKFRQNSSEPLKDFAIVKLWHQALRQRDYYLRKSFAGLEAAREEEEDDFEEESSAAISELFHGFLAIGTLGSDPVVNDPSTPTFAISVENITEKETEVTENELKLINDELEKVLGAEAKEDGYSSGEIVMLAQEEAVM